MNIKKQVFKYMSKHPEATTSDLVSVFPEAKKKSLWNYSREWKKDQGIQPTAGRNSVRQRVFSFINQNPDATQKDLQQAFPDANKVSISNYHYQWRKTQPHRKKKKNVKTIVFSYLDQNPEATYGELKNALNEINPSSISAYHSIWKQTQSKGKNANTVSHSKKRLRQAESGKPFELAAKKSAKELIEALKTTIKTQEIAIEVMKEQNALLKQDQPELLTDLKGISKKEWQRLKKIVTVFIKGMRQN